MTNPLGAGHRGALRRRHRPRRGRHRRADRHLRLAARPVADPEPLLPLPPDRQRHRRVAGAGRRHGRGHRRPGPRPPPPPAPRSSPVPASADPDEPGRRAEVAWHDGTATRSVTAPARARRASPRGCCGSCSARTRTPQHQARGRPAQDQLPARPAAAAPVGCRPRRRLRRHPAPRRGLQPARDGVRRGGGRPGARRRCRARSTATRSPTPRSSATLAGTGAQTLTYFGLHTPAALFDDRPRGAPSGSPSSARSPRSTSTSSSRSSRASRTDADGDPCIEAKIPQDVERDLAMPGGHIFHGDLDWPWAPNRLAAGHPGAAVGRPDRRRRRCCSAAPEPVAAAPSPGSAGTTRRRPCSPISGEASRFHPIHDGV